ncbi:MAG: divergent polysaccharide deacetylase family protein [Deltaproteobacteria bacterium]|nr:divergent polysaccharide deacetylase family protein [Deltaproteobacteria bacterium]
MQIPVYEEMYAAEGDFYKKVKEVDFAIYEALYRNGANKSDVFFLDIQPRHHNGNIWEFTELLIRCPDSNSARRFQKFLNDEMNSAGINIRLRIMAQSENETVVHAYLGEYFTHKIIIRIIRKTLSHEHMRPKISIIIDDLGYESDLAFSFLELDTPLTFSILPYGPFTKLLSENAINNGHEVLLHLPMEPKGYPSVNPGPGSLLLSMKDFEISSALEKALTEIDGAVGISNHMGSAFTESREKMMIVLSKIKEKGLFFIDSRTTSGTVGFQEAKNIGLPAASRNVFLDNDLDKKAIKMQIERLLNIARHSGSAIGIGHPHEETLSVLQEYFPELKNEFDFVVVSELVDL